MRILLDECIDESLRHAFTGHDCQTCRFAGMKGLSNGKLVDAAEKAGFNVLVTVDQNFPRQQNIYHRTLSVILLRGATTNIDDLIPLMPSELAALETLQPGKLLRIAR